MFSVLFHKDKRESSFVIIISAHPNVFDRFSRNNPRASTQKVKHEVLQDILRM